jgi:hypothetical protein
MQQLQSLSKAVATVKNVDTSVNGHIPRVQRNEEVGRGFQPRQ